jgi:hypothetical protein
MEENPIMRGLIAETLRQNEEAQNDPNTPESVKRVLKVQALTIKALDAQLNASNEQLFYIVSQITR